MKESIKIFENAQFGWRKMENHCFALLTYARF